MTDASRFLDIPRSTFHWWAQGYDRGGPLLHVTSAPARHGQVPFIADRYPTLLGYCLVAPKRHVESWLDDLDGPEFLALQRVVRMVAKAVAAVVPTERMYSLTLGSQQGNAHLYWHVAPLPPGIPYNRQQYHVLMAENGVLDVDDESQAELARQIRRQIRAGRRGPA